MAQFCYEGGNKGFPVRAPPVLQHGDFVVFGTNVSARGPTPYHLLVMAIKEHCARFIAQYGFNTCLAPGMRRPTCLTLQPRHHCWLPMMDAVVGWCAALLTSAQQYVPLLHPLPR